MCVCEFGCLARETGSSFHKREKPGEKRAGRVVVEGKERPGAGWGESVSITCMQTNVQWPAYVAPRYPLWPSELGCPSLEAL